MKEEVDPNSDNSNDNSPLVAAYAGSMDFLVPFIQAGGSPSYSNTDGDSLLHAAASGWQYHMVEFLIISGGNPNTQNCNGDTPLHALVRQRNIPSDGTFISKSDPHEARNKTFLTLLLRKAKKEIKNIQGATPLHLAAWGGDLFAINRLADPATINELTTKGATAHTLAILHGHAECAERLVEFGASVQQLD